MPQLATTHHNPPQPTTTHHNSPQVPEVPVVVPQLTTSTTTHLASFRLHHNSPQLATTHLARFCLCNELPQLTTTYHNSPQPPTSPTHHNSPQLTTTYHNSWSHELMIKNALLFTTVSLWPNGLRRLALHEVVSGSNPGFTRFSYFLALFSRFRFYHLQKLCLVRLGKQQQDHCHSVFNSDGRYIVAFKF